MKYYKLAGVLAFSMAVSWFTPCAVMAGGPGDNSAAVSDDRGPGGAIGTGGNGGQGEEGTGADTVQDPNDISLKESSNPVVRPVAIYTYDQMVQDIRTLQSRYGSRMRAESFGTSLDGRKLYEIVIGNQNAGKHVMIQAGIHGREYMTPLLVMKQLETALEFYDTANYRGEPLKNMLDKVQVHFLPMVNPDGVCISQTGLFGLRSGDLRNVMEEGFRKDLEEERADITLDKYVLYCKGNGRGVDLNLNFPANWDNILMSPGHASYMGYRGEAAGSEPETKGVMNLVKKYHWSASVSYHSKGEVIYWDFPGNKVKEESRMLAESFAEDTGYQLLGADGKGGFKDWMQIKDNPVPSITVETGTAECPMPFSEWAGVWSKNRSGWAAALYYGYTHG